MITLISLLLLLVGKYKITTYMNKSFNKKQSRSKKLFPFSKSVPIVKNEIDFLYIYYSAYTISKARNYSVRFFCHKINYRRIYTRRYIVTLFYNSFYSIKTSIKTCKTNNYTNSSQNETGHNSEFCKTYKRTKADINSDLPSHQFMMRKNGR